MKIDMSLLLKDVPGSLIKAIEPISSHGGNIMSVQHNRAKNGYADVQVTFEAKDKKSLGFIQKGLGENSVSVKEIFVEGRLYLAKKTLSFIVVGHVIDEDLQDTIDRINQVGVVSDVDVVMPDPQRKSSVLFTCEFDQKEQQKLMSVVNEICRRKKFLLINSLDN
ncbi:MAG: hypothetical protein ABH950_02420 [Candidatus Altiarchaeota archaeon]